MIGEMRDRETAEIAVQAAMTGHLVFSTLHTNDAVSAVPRLLDLDVPDFLLAATLECVLAQRLVRRICDRCRARYEPSAEQVAALAGRPIGRLELWRGTGCPECRGTGFRGRLGIFELLVMTDAIREAVAGDAVRSRLRTLAIEGGLQPLRADGWRKVEAGLTTIEEVIRVVHE
jgi:type II secretory ATPase GspE/PulE/Tfp pilus assembly ATPase PilB-like protein